MPSLKEIKGRISSVRSTLKITSAMKMVASAKLHRAEAAIGNMVPYEEHLNEILHDLMMDFALNHPDDVQMTGAEFTAPRDKVHHVAIIAFASNSSLCGSFNSNAIRKTLEAIKSYRAAGLSAKDITVYSVGRKMADAMKKAGYPTPHDYVKLSDKPNYADAAALAQEVMSSYVDGHFDKVELVYNHFQSTASQPTQREVFLPLDLSVAQTKVEGHKSMTAGNFIIEPSVDYEISVLLPKVLLLKVYTVLLDTAAAEHAARTIAMQTATDNGNDILQDLTLQYNKSRQQKITSEILDIVGGTMQ